MTSKPQQSNVPKSMQNRSPARGAADGLDAADTEAAAAASLNLDLMSSDEIASSFVQSAFEVAEAVKTAASELGVAIELTVNCLSRGGRILILGAGTSGRLAAAEAAECPPTFSTDPDLVVARMAGGEHAFIQAIEGAEDDTVAGVEAVADAGADDLIIAVSASGYAPYVRSALAAARQRGVANVLICSNRQAVGVASHTVFLDTGPELLSGSTRLKAGSAAKVALNAITTGAFARLGRVFGQSMVEVKVTNSKLRRRAERLVSQLGRTGLDQAAKLLDLTQNDVKAAIVCARKNCSATEATQILDQCQRQLRQVLDGGC